MSDVSAKEAAERIVARLEKRRVRFAAIWPNAKDPLVSDEETVATTHLSLLSALQAIVDRQRYVHRETVSPDNAFEHFSRLNQEWVKLHDELAVLIIATKKEKSDV